MKHLFTLLALLSVMTVKAAEAFQIPPSGEMQTTLSTLSDLYPGVQATMPAKAAKAEADDAQWGEWTMEFQGTMEVDGLNMLSFATFAGLHEVPVTVYCRDNSADPDHSQLKLSGALQQNLDMIFDWDRTTNKLTFDEMDTPFPLYKDYIMSDRTTVLISSSEACGYPNNANYYVPGNRIRIGDIMLCATDDHANLRVYLDIYSEKRNDMVNSIQWDTDKLFQGDRARLMVAENPNIKNIDYKVYQLTLTDDTIQASIRPGEAHEIAFDADGVYAAYCIIEDMDGVKSFVTRYISVINSTPDRWVPAGKALFSEVPLVSSYMSVNNEEYYVVDMERNMDHPTLLRAVQPFNKNVECDGRKDFPFLGDEYFSVYNDQDAGHVYYQIFDVQDTVVYIPHVGTPFTMCINPKDAHPEFSPVYAGRYDGSGVTFADGMLHVNGKLVFRLLPDTYMELYENTSGRPRLAITNDNVDKVWYTSYITGYMSAEDAIGRIVREANGESTGIKVVNTDRSGNLDLSAFSVSYSNTVVAVALDKDGEMLQADSISFIIPDEFRYNGKAMVRDGVLSGLYRFEEDAIITVDAYTLDETPGVLYLRDVYTNPTSPFAGLASEEGADEDMAISFSDPSRVTFPLYGTGVIVSYTVNEETRSSELEFQAEGYGKVISQADGLLISMPDGSIYPRVADGYFPNSGVFEVFISYDDMNTGIQDIPGGSVSGADGQAAWYNMQGMKVTSPSASGIYVKRQGGKASKVLIP